MPLAARRALASSLAVLTLLTGGCSGGTDDTDATPNAGPHFDLTVSGPTLPETQNFELDVERLSWNVGSDYSFVVTFLTNDDGIVSEDGAFVLTSVIGGVSAEVMDGPGSVPLGATGNNANGWNIIIWPTGCPDNYVGCDRVNIDTTDGTMEVAEVVLGESASRPHEEGPTIISASFEANAIELDPPNEGRAFEVEGHFYLEDGG